MPLLPVAAFLAGALLSLLLPVALLIALTVWYMLFVRRIPETVADNPAAPDSRPGGQADAATGSGEDVGRGPISGEPASSAPRPMRDG